MSRRTGKGAVGVCYTLMAVFLCLMILYVVSAPRPASSYLSQTTDYRRQPLVRRRSAGLDLSAWEDRGTVAYDIQQQGLDKLQYLPLVFKGHINGYCVGYLPDRQRFGFGAPGNPVDQYDVSLLHAGWYHTFWFQADPPSPDGLEFAQTIRLCDPATGPDCENDYVPDQQAIVDYATAHPTALWIIGNEPDAPLQDCITPSRYAQLYHELYGIIKGADPTARVAIGGVVQATPLRLRYLDMILQEYETLYGEMIPVDVWNVHGFILREKRYPPDHWGCQIPCGITDVDTGILYEVDDHDNMTFFKQQIVAFRQWMNDHGERDKPLIVTEYGILMPDIYGFDEPRVQAFMLATFDYFLTASNPSYGYPADCGKLVQGWAWYSLDDAHFQEPFYNSYSHLFDPDTKTISNLGIAYGNYTSSLP